MAKRTLRTATSPEDREAQLVALAVDLAEKQLRDGTAPATTVNHYLKLGSMREQLERQRLEGEIAQLKAKTEYLEQSRVSEEAYREALEAFKTYAGVTDEEVV